jgi:peptide deformylase
VAVRPILRIGDPRLRQVAEPVDEFDTPELHELIRDMFDTMAAADGAGLAAPQVGVLKRIMIFGIESSSRYQDVEVVPTTVLINPEFEVIDEARQGFWEGCLSVPGMRGYVERPAGIRYRGYDQYGEFVEREADGFHAIVFQHEYDHLDGILYPDRIDDYKKFGFDEELAAAGVV